MNLTFQKFQISTYRFFGFFTEIIESNISKFNNDIQFLNLVYQFTLELIKNHSLVPELFKSGNTYHIRWIPAIFDGAISKSIDILTASCPDDLITFKNQRISKKDQIITAVSLFVKGFDEKYLKHGVAQSIKKNYDKFLNCSFSILKSLKMKFQHPNQLISGFQSFRLIPGIMICICMLKSL